MYVFMCFPYEPYVTIRSISLTVQGCGSEYAYSMDTTLSYLVIVGYPEYRIPRSWQPPWPKAFGLHLPFY